MKLQQFFLVLSVLAVSISAHAADPPSLPTAPVLLIGDPGIDAGKVVDHQATFALGRAAEHQALETAGAFQESTVERLRVGDRSVLRRVHTVRRPDSEQVLSRASIDVDPATLLPLSAEVEQRGNTLRFDYDWERYVVRRSPGSDGAEADEMSLDLAMFEVGAHDLWMASLPYEEGFTARVPVLFAATGTKYWAVPRVVGSEKVDLGSVGSRDAWVVELDWWGMGADNIVDNHSSGGGKDGTAGPGGKYWILKQAESGLPRVVRVRTEIDPAHDSIVELQPAGP